MTFIRRTYSARLLAIGCALAGVVGQPVCAGGVKQAQVDRLEIAVARAEDVSALKKLQRAYGHYADRGLWDQLAGLFADGAAANYPSGGFDGKASIRAMFVDNLGQGKQGLADGRIYNHTILQPVVDLARDGATATARWRVLGMLGRFGTSAIWADSLYRFDYEKVNGTWKIKTLTAYAGSGGSYADGWVQPAPRAPGALDRSPIRFNLAHPADRDWRDPCEADVSVCVVPFPYANRGGIKPPENPAALIAPMKYASPAARAADLVARARRLADEQALLNLQDEYGYYVDRGMWRQAAGLFAPNGTREEGQEGVYLGREHIRRDLALAAPDGLRTDELNEHLQLEPIIDVADDGKSARGRIFELALVGGGRAPARIVQSVAENEYTKHGDVWMIQTMHVYTILATDYDQGWAKSALPPPWPSKDFPPDAPPTVMYQTYPQVFTPPLHAGFDTASRPSRAALRSAASMPSARGIDAAEKQVQRVMDWNEIENLQDAYGYYAEKAMWTDLAQLFTDDGVLAIDDAEFAGRNTILALFKAMGPEGPAEGALNSQLQLQPVIDIAADGKTAKIRARLLQLARDGKGRPIWGGAIYENELVKEDGIWKFQRLHLYRSYQFPYRGGWAATDGAAQLWPSRFAQPFHYGSPVSGEPARGGIGHVGM